MKFPITLQNKKEFKQFLKKHKLEILSYYHIDKKINKLKNKLKDTKEQQQQLIDKNKELEHLANLKEKQIGENSMFKGEFDEKQKEHIFREYFGETFIIDGTKKMHCMDIRMKHKEFDLTIGIECKNKKSIVQNDINKFKNDKIKNNFKLSILLSTCSSIPKKVNSINNYYYKNDELYIYSNDLYYIVIVMQVFIVQQIENIDTNNERNYAQDLFIDIITNLYKNWTNVKKTCLKMDQDFVFSLQKVGIELVNGHLYLNSKNKCKKNCNPY